MLAPGSYVVARAAALPGADQHAHALALGTRLLVGALRRRRAELFVDALRLILHPMDTFRYYELPIVLRWLEGGDLPQRYLDISSPRLLPIGLLDRGWAMQSDLLNPDARDLAATKRIVDALAIGRGVDFHNCTVEGLSPDERGYDVITTVSVVEHIEDDGPVLERIWQLLNPGGRVYISLPCAAQGFEELIDYDEYGLGKPDRNGYVFGQRYYDEGVLADRVFRILGQPTRCEVVGEIVPGFFFENREAKHLGGYPHWKEPLVVKKGIRPFGSVRELPGVGVVIMEFCKPDAFDDRPRMPG